MKENCISVCIRARLQPVPNDSSKTLSYRTQSRNLPDLLIPEPPSRARISQPVFEIAKRLSTATKIRFSREALRKIMKTDQLKKGLDYQSKMADLRGAFEVSREEVSGKSILVFVDLYDSGATLNTIVAELKRRGARRVYVLTLTKTRG